MLLSLEALFPCRSLSIFVFIQAPSRPCETTGRPRRRNDVDGTQISRDQQSQAMSKDTRRLHNFTTSPPPTSHGRISTQQRRPRLDRRSHRTVPQSRRGERRFRRRRLVPERRRIRPLEFYGRQRGHRQRRWRRRLRQLRRLTRSDEQRRQHELPAVRLECRRALDGEPDDGERPDDRFAFDDRQFQRGRRRRLHERHDEPGLRPNELHGLHVQRRRRHDVLDE